MSFEEFRMLVRILMLVFCMPLAIYFFKVMLAKELAEVNERNSSGLKPPMHFNCRCCIATIDEQINDINQQINDINQQKVK